VAATRHDNRHLMVLPLPIMPFCRHHSPCDRAFSHCQLPSAPSPLWLCLELLHSGPYVVRSLLVLEEDIATFEATGQQNAVRVLEQVKQLVL